LKTFTGKAIVSSAIVLILTRILLTLTAVGGFIISIYLVPLVITYSCETLAGSVAQCLAKVGCVIFLHFLAPFILLFLLSTSSQRVGYLLMGYGVSMGLMYYLTGPFSLAVGVFAFLSGVYFVRGDVKAFSSQSTPPPAAV
jgi:hypothetical protein